MSYGMLWVVWYCYARELHAYDFAMKDFGIKKVLSVPDPVLHGSD